jgi:hypothetical protein
MVICEECHGEHDRSHLPKMMRFEIMQWMSKLKGVDEAVSCRHCAKLSVIRWQCKDCKKALCRKCVSDFQARVNFFTKHQEEHPDDRAFLSIYPPYWTTLRAWLQQGDCPCVSIEPGAFSHCERCHSGKFPFRWLPSISVNFD